MSAPDWPTVTLDGSTIYLSAGEFRPETWVELIAGGEVQRVQFKVVLEGLDGTEKIVGGGIDKTWIVQARKT